MPSLHETQARVMRRAASRRCRRSRRRAAARAHGDQPRASPAGLPQQLRASLAAALAAVYPGRRTAGRRRLLQAARARLYRCASRRARATCTRSARSCRHSSRRSRRSRACPTSPTSRALEWACHEVYHEADERARSTRRARGACPLERRRGSACTCSSRRRFVASPWPVLAIWQANQADADERRAGVSLDDGGVRVLVARRGFEVEFRIARRRRGPLAARARRGPAARPRPRGRARGRLRLRPRRDARPASRARLVPRAGRSPPTRRRP